MIDQIISFAVALIAAGGITEIAVRLRAAGSDAGWP